MKSLKVFVAISVLSLATFQANAQHSSSQVKKEDTVIDIYDGRIIGKWEASKTVGSTTFSEKLEITSHTMSEVLSCKAWGNPFSGVGNLPKSEVSIDTPIRLKDNKISILEDRSASNAEGATPCDLQRPQGSVADFTVEGDTLTIGHGESALVFKKVKDNK